MTNEMLGESQAMLITKLADLVVMCYFLLHVVNVGSKRAKWLTVPPLVK